MPLKRKETKIRRTDEDYFFIVNPTAPEDSLWAVYHYRGDLMEVFDAEQDAIDFILAQDVPSEYYREIGA